MFPKSQRDSHSSVFESFDVLAKATSTFYTRTSEEANFSRIVMAKHIAKTIFYTFLLLMTSSIMLYIIKQPVLKEVFVRYGGQANYENRMLLLLHNTHENIVAVYFLPCQ